MNNMTRRHATKLIGAGVGALVLPIRATHGQATSESPTMLTRAISSSGEKLPVIGLGTWNVFDVDLTPTNEKQFGDVLGRFVNLGGPATDPSPMRGGAEG